MHQHLFFLVHLYAVKLREGRPDTCNNILQGLFLEISNLLLLIQSTPRDLLKIQEWRQDFQQFCRENELEISVTRLLDTLEHSTQNPVDHSFDTLKEEALRWIDTILLFHTCSPKNRNTVCNGNCLMTSTERAIYSNIFPAQQEKIKERVIQFHFSEDLLPSSVSSLIEYLHGWKVTLDKNPSVQPTPSIQPVLQKLESIESVVSALVQRPQQPLPNPDTSVLARLETSLLSLAEEAKWIPSILQKLDILERSFWTIDSSLSHKWQGMQTILQRLDSILQTIATALERLDRIEQTLSSMPSPPPEPQPAQQPEPQPAPQSEPQPAQQPESQPAPQSEPPTQSSSTTVSTFIPAGLKLKPWFCPCCGNIEKADYLKEPSFTCEMYRTKITIQWQADSVLLKFPCKSLSIKFFCPFDGGLLRVTNVFEILCPQCKKKIAIQTESQEGHQKILTIRLDRKDFV
jgi:hypothetical protein